LPIFWGFVLAYLLNPVVVKLEKYIFMPLATKLFRKKDKEKKQWKFARAWGVVTTLALFMLLLTGGLCVVIPQLYGSFLFGKGAVNGSTDAWKPMFKGPVPCYPNMNNFLGGAEMGRYIDQHLPFIGLNKISFAFNNVAILRADIRTRLFKNHYLTAMVNYGRSAINFENFFKQSNTLQWEEMYDYNASNWWGAGIRYSIDTKIGPVSFDVSSSNISRNVNLYFSLGHYF
jgi:hypothetical protein